MNQRGQSMVEMVFLIPLLLMLAAGAMFVVYCCSQGLKVQQAANLAARIQGQERIAGGVSGGTIQSDNGVTLGADGTPNGPSAGDFSGSLSLSYLNILRSARTQSAPSSNSVYGEIQKAVRQFFNTLEWENVFVPPPSYGSAGNTDTINVFRVIIPPSNLFGLNLQILTLGATAYGGEDPRAFGLPRWGSTSANGAGGPFWSQKNAQGNFVNLPKGND